MSDTRQVDASENLLKKKAIKMLVEAKEIMLEQQALIEKQRKVLYKFLSCMQKAAASKTEEETYLNVEMPLSVLEEATKIIQAEYE